MRLGITGYATAGKDEVANVLIEEYGFVKVNMSDPLDRYLQILDPIVSFKSNLDPIRYAELRQQMSYSDAKKYTEVRKLLQRLGTDVGRDIDEDLWVKLMQRNTRPIIVAGGHTVTTGIRYANEAAAMDFLVHVHRGGVGPINDHPSEDLSEIFRSAHYQVMNLAGLDELRAEAHQLAAHLKLVRA